MRHAARILFSLAFFALASPAAAQAVVNCYDADRELVSRTMAGRCDGVAVSDEKAAEIRARRIGRVQQAVRAAQAAPLVPDRRLASVGTGFFVDSDGFLVTNNHVVDECAVLTVEATNGESARAELVAVEPRLDLAVVRTTLAAPAVAAFRPPAPIAVGSRADLVGYPTQGVAPITPFFTKGETLELPGRLPDAARFMIRGDVRGGNSGGPVLDSAGAVIGVIFAETNTPKIYKETGRVVKDVGFAIRNEAVLDFLRRNGVDWRTERDGGSLTRNEVFEAAKPFVARIGCWR